MNNPISSSGAKLAGQFPLDECFDILAEAGIKVVDFWLGRYCKTSGIPMGEDNWRDWAREVAKMARDRGLTIGQIHAHWDHHYQINEDFSHFTPPEIMLRNFEAAHIMGSHKLIFHPILRFARFKNEEERRRVLDINVEWFSSMLPLAEKFGVEIHIENLFDYKHIGQPGDPVFPCSTAEDLLYIVEKLNSPLAKVCIDTGHANIAGQDVAAMIRKVGDKLGSLHMDDNYGLIGPIYEDVHLFPGYARVKWNEIFAALRETGYEGTLNMEPCAEMHRMPREICVIQMRAAREILEVMRRVY